jgi:branched-chain amino acid transport system substrate-binding protein
MSRKFIFVVCCWTSALQLSCSSASKKFPPSPAPFDAKKELNLIQIEAAAGSEKKAMQRLKNLIGKHPKSDVADDATIQLARLYFKQQNFDMAYRAYMGLIESDVFSPNEAEALLGAAKSLHRMGRLDESLALTARGLKIPGLSDTHKLELHRHRYQLLITTGDRLEALRSIAYIHERDFRPEARANAQARASEIVSQFLNEPDLEMLVDDPQYGFIRAQAALRLGFLRLRQKDFDGARNQFSRAAEWGQGTPVQTQAQSYILQIDSRRRVDPFTIGAVLPLTGKHGAIAQRTLHGLQLGLGIYGSDLSHFKLAVVDSEGTPEGARKAVERLVVEDSAIAVVGSLLSKTAASVAAKSEELGVPSIALSQKAGLTEMGSFIFRNAVTSEMQVRELVRMAMDQLGMKRFAILYPNDAYGVEFANLFWDEVLARGGRITGAQIYSPQETDFRGPIKRLIGTYYLEDRRSEYSARLRDWYRRQNKISARQTPPDDLLPPVLDFDAVFIPDTSKAVGQIAPMLAYQGVSGVRLLGTNVWNTADLVRRGEKNVENALFVDSSLTNDPAFKTSKFYREYQKVFGEEPGLFEAQGFEVGLMLRQMITAGERTRVGLVQALSNQKQYQGVLGPLTMSPQRELLRPLTPYIVKNNSISLWTEDLEQADASQPGARPGSQKKSKK